MEMCLVTMEFTMVLILILIGVSAACGLVVHLARRLAKSEKLRIEAEYDAKRFKSELDALEKKLMD